ncbi:MAG: TraR/DksA family transcriptional regulator, partial [Mycobacteriales bacterium]
LAFERQQVVALLQQAKASLAQAEQALRREADGSYGTCEGCGGSIGAARLEARPSASLCIACASSQSRRR